jgi:hypothetical protein
LTGGPASVHHAAMVMGWLRSLREVKPGTVVAVGDGPYAGKSGVVRAVAADGRLSVYIDECCQPTLDASQVKPVRGPDIAGAARKARLADTRGELDRHIIDSRDMGNGF